MLAHMFHSFEFQVTGFALIKSAVSVYYLNVLHHLLNLSEFRSTPFTYVFIKDIHVWLMPYLTLLVPTFST
jgi:hypothetical protein